MLVEEKYIEINGKKLWTKHLLHKAFANPLTIVFLHDALGSIAQWKALPERVFKTTGHDVFLYDRLGHGLSESSPYEYDHRTFDREALVILPEIMERMCIQEPVIYGHSDGGTIALIYASKIRASALVLEAAHILVEDKTKKGVVDLTKQKDKITGKLGKYHGKKAEKLFLNWSKLWSGDLMDDWNIAFLLDRIDIPCLIMQGKEDPYATEEQLRLIEKGINGQTEIYLIEHCGHELHKEAPQKVVNRIQLFFNKQLVK